MSECLITRHGGKYRVGKLIFGNNLSVIQNDFAEIWSNNNYSNGRQIVTDNNDVYVLCINPTSAICKLSGVDGTVIWTKDIGGSFIAKDIAADSSGDVYVSLVNSGICKLSGVDGSQIWYYGNGEWGQRLATDSNNDVYLSSLERSHSSPIRKLSGVDGTVIWTNSDVGYNGSITTDDANNVYVLSGSVKKVRKLSGVDGSEIWHSNTGTNLNSLAVDNNGHLYGGRFYDYYIGEIRKLSSTNGFEISIKDSMGVVDIAVENTKYVYVVYNSIVQKLSTNPIYTIIS